MVLQRSSHPLITTLSAALLTVTPLAQADDTPVANDGHLHIGLVNSIGTTLQAADVDRLAVEVGTEGFLQKKATESDNPLAPCSLLAASLTGAHLNHLFFETIVGSLTLPPRGTYIFGKYDWKSVLWFGSLPSDPGTAADALARLTVIRSWGVSVIAASNLSKFNQTQCVDLLTDPDKASELVNKLDKQSASLAHPAFVSNYFATTDKTNGDKLLEPLATPEMLAKPASDRANPLAPCSLLRSFRLAARLNEDWSMVGAGKLQVPDNALLRNFPPEAGQSPLPDESPLKPLADKLHDVAFLRGGSAQSAEVIARAFGHEIVRTNQLTEMLLEASQATQADCLTEIRQPSTLRLRLIEQKISLPWR